MIESAALVDLVNIALIRENNSILSQVNWKIFNGQRWVIFGPNGAGKTSLLKIIAGMEYPTSGTATILEERLGKTNLVELKTRIGWSSAALINKIPKAEKVIDFVMSAAYAIFGKWKEKYGELDTQQALNCLEKMGAIHLADRNIGILSEGETKRVLIARALMTNPEILLLDEPAAGLDLGAREELVYNLASLAKMDHSPAIVLITHLVEEIPNNFTHMLLLAEGKVVVQGEIDKVLTNKNLETAYGQSIIVEKHDGRFFARRKNPIGKHRSFEW